MSSSTGFIEFYAEVAKIGKNSDDINNCFDICMLRVYIAVEKGFHSGLACSLNENPSITEQAELQNYFVQPIIANICVLRNKIPVVTNLVANRFIG